MERIDKSFWLLTIVLMTSAYLLQSLWFLNGDVGSLLYDTKLFLHGGRYITDFLETNPPMIFLIYSPVYFMQELLHWSYPTIIRLYVIGIATLSLLLVGNLCKSILNSESICKLGLLYILLFAFLFLPISEFGQREHFFIMLCMPYVFLVAMRAYGHPVSRQLALLIGLLAALGIGMKPYFLAPFVMLEIYVMVLKRHVLAWVRCESLTAGVVLIIYFCLVLYFYPEYFSQMLPLISHLYYIGIMQPWLLFFSRLPVMYTFFIMGYSVMKHPKPSAHDKLIRIMEITLIGMVIAYVIPQAAWYYHIFPAIVVATLLLYLYLYQYFSDNFKNSLAKKLFYFTMMLTLAIPFYFFLVGTNYSYHIKRYSDLNELANFINTKFTKPSIFCFSSNTTGDCFTLIYQTASTYGGRYPFFWWMKGLHQLESQGPLSAEIKEDKNFLINAIAEDLNTYKPTLVIINTHDAKMTHGEDFTFGSYFSQNKNFFEAWQHYQYFATIGVFAVYHRT